MHSRASPGHVLPLSASPRNNRIAQHAPESASGPPPSDSSSEALVQPITLAPSAASALPAPLPPPLLQLERPSLEEGDRPRDEYGPQPAEHVPAPAPPSSGGWYYVPRPMFVIPAVDWDGHPILLWRSVQEYYRAPARDDNHNAPADVPVDVPTTVDFRDPSTSSNAHNATPSNDPHGTSSIADLIASAFPSSSGWVDGRPSPSAPTTASAAEEREAISRPVVEAAVATLEAWLEQEGVPVDGFRAAVLPREPEFPGGLAVASGAVQTTTVEFEIKMETDD
ncbi:hypothetical protein AURDEDRAFT_176526 [Auricularia subglabra TFB-10046 SS5]|uniref:Uncharacterized protein n=1 Tax=Auricularia subglabra (strain TFB-10046 / SS5) TaxID=717982 RepID=J0D6E9_AURST|nr:hypothetical protein AURDEDRAFT_176526 [Auricularia subglabra TFB-10046 SS5]